MQAPSPLDESQLGTLAQTKQAKRKLRVAGFVALANAVGLGLSAIFSLAFASLESSLSPIGLVLIALAVNEWRGRVLLLGGDTRAPRRLAFNQVALFAAVCTYCAYGAYVAWTSPSLLDVVFRSHPELSDALGSASSPSESGSIDELGEWARTVSLIVYGAVAVGSLVVQGLTALYYLSLKSAVQTVSLAPPWARELSS